VAAYRLGQRDRAQTWLQKSAQLLPTAPAALYLGNIARDGGDRATALRLYEVAASAGGTMAQQAQAEAARMSTP
jgi:hypothetical protein